MDEAPTNTITVDGNDLISKIKDNPKLDEKAIKITEALVEGKKIQKAVESIGQLRQDLRYATTKDEKAKIGAQINEESLTAKRGTKYQQKYFADYYNHKHPPGWIGTAVKDEGTEVKDYIEKKGNIDNDKKVQEFQDAVKLLSEKIPKSKADELAKKDPFKSPCIGLYYLFFNKVGDTIYDTQKTSGDILIKPDSVKYGDKEQNITKLIDSLNEVIQKKEENEKELLEYYKGRLEEEKNKSAPKEVPQKKGWISSILPHSNKSTTSTPTTSTATNRTADAAKGTSTALNIAASMGLSGGKKSRKRCNKSKRKNKNNKTRKAKPKRKSRKNSRS